MADKLLKFRDDVLTEAEIKALIDDDYVNVTGDTMTGDLNFTGNDINNITDINFFAGNFNDTQAININGTRAILKYNGTNTSFDVIAGSGKNLRLFADGTTEPDDLYITFNTLANGSDIDIFKDINLQDNNLTTTGTITTTELIGTGGTGNNTIYLRDGGTDTNGGRLSDGGTSSTFAYSDTDNYQNKITLSDNLMLLSVGAGLGNLGTINITSTESTFDKPIVIGTSTSSLKISQPNIFGDSSEINIDSDGDGQGFLQMLTGDNTTLQLSSSSLSLLGPSGSTNPADFTLQRGDTNIVNGEILSRIYFQGLDSASRVGGYIQAKAFQTWGTNTNDAPTNIWVYAQSDGNSNTLGTAIAGFKGVGQFEAVQDFKHSGTNFGIFNTTPTTKPTITGSRGGNVALASLLTGGASLGLWTDSTSA